MLRLQTHLSTEARLDLRTCGMPCLGKLAICTGMPCSRHVIGSTRLLAVRAFPNAKSPSFSTVDVSVSASPLLPEQLFAVRFRLITKIWSTAPVPDAAHQWRPRSRKRGGRDGGEGLLVWPSPGSSRADMHRPFNRQFAKHMPSCRPDSTEPNHRLGCVHNRTSFILAGRRTTTAAASRTRSLPSTNDSS